MNTEIQQTCPECGRALNPQLDGICGACLLQDEEADRAAGNISVLVEGHALGRELARGGMGVVHEATQLEPFRKVAVKFLLPQLVTDSAMLQRFRAESAAAASLEHPAILPVYETGESRGLPWFTMKLATGGTLSGRKAQYAGKWREIARLMHALADAVHYAHGRGVLHRDIKPANVLFDEAGRPYLTDFGLAKQMGTEHGITLAESVFGTPNYLSPEVAAGGVKQATTASDIWGLGAMFYELLTGRPPYEAENIQTLLRRIQEAEPPPPYDPDNGGPPAPRDLAMICAKCLRHEPDRRYQSAAALMSDLVAWEEGRPVTARHPPPLERVWLKARRHPAIAMLSVLLFLTGAAGLWQMYRAGAEARARLHMALISTARNARSSTQPGAREQVLASLRQAAAIDPSSEVRNELISALAMTSLHVSQITPWRGTLAPGWSQDLTTEARLEENAVKLYRNGNPLPAPAMEIGRIPVEIGNFSPDGKWLAMKMPDESNAVWSLERNTWLEYLPALRMVCFSPDSQTLVGDSGGGTLYVRPMDKAEGIYVHWDRNSLRPLGYSPDGRYFAVSHYAHPRMAVLSTDTWKEVYRYELPATGRIRCLAWQPDSRGFAVGTENLKIYEWKLREGAIPYQYLGHSATIFALAYHPTQPLLVSQSWDGTTRVWDSLSRQINAVFPWMGRRTFFTPDGMTLCMENETDSSTVLVSYSPSEACRTFTVQHRDLDEVGTAGCWSVDFNPDGTLLACGDTSGLWMFHLDKPLPPLLLMDTYCWNAAFSTDGTRILGSTSDSVRQWRLTPATATSPLTTMELPAVFDGSTSQAAVASKAKAVAIAVKGGVWLHREEKSPLFLEDSEYKFDRVAINASASMVAGSHSVHPGVSLWSVDPPPDDPVTPAHSPQPRHLTTATEEASLLFSNDGSRLYVASLETLECYDSATLRVLWQRERTTPSHESMHLAINFTDELLAVNLEARHIQLLSPATGQTLLTLEHPQAARTGALQLSPDGEKLAVFSGGHQIRIWDLAYLKKTLHAEGFTWPLRSRKL